MDSAREAAGLLDAGAFADLLLGPMDAEEAAEFLGLSEDAFRKLAPSLPRLPLDGKSYRYLRSELLEWLRSNREDREGRAGRRQPDGNVPARIPPTPAQKAPKGKVKRLI